MTTTEKNKLIAEFMGLDLINLAINPIELNESLIKVGKHYINTIDKKIFECTKTAFPLVIVEENEKGFYCANIKNCKEVSFTNDLKYNSSWDWLMPVVERIESLGYWINAKRNFCIIEVFGNDYEAKNKNTFFVNKKQWAETKLEAVYNAVVEFILWYNQQNK